MATVTIVITDQGKDGDITTSFDYGAAGFDPNSEAHTLAAELSMELKDEGKADD